jgi:suppressor of fused protein SUFU
MAGSSCDHLLVSLPYPFGPELEVVANAAKKTRILWLLPITKAERDYKIAYGLESLERLFDSNAIHYWAAGRASAVPPRAG